MTDFRNVMTHTALHGEEAEVEWAHSLVDELSEAYGLHWAGLMEDPEIEAQDALFATTDEFNRLGVERLKATNVGDAIERIFLTALIEKNPGLGNLLEHETEQRKRIIIPTAS
jgi:hypothetical protein